MIRVSLSRCLPLTPAIALLAVIAFAAPAGAQYASCNALSQNYGPAWNPGSYSLGGASYYVDADTNYGSGSTGWDGAAQAACQAFSQANGLSGVCQDAYSYNYNVQYMSPTNPDIWMCGVEICQFGGTTYQWSYAFYPNVNALGYVAPQSGGYSTDDGSWVTSVSWQNTSDAGVCTYTPPPTPPTAALSANPMTIEQGAGTTLSWSSTNASSCTGTNFSTGGAPSGAVAVYPSTSTYYAVTCNGAGGAASSGVTVGVQPRPATNPQAACSADATSVTLSWTAASGATSYNPRVSPVSAAQCASIGWQMSGTTCFPNPDTWGSTSVVNFPITPNQGYSWWVHSANAAGVNWGDPMVSSFTCTPVLPDLSASVSATVSGTAGSSQTFTGTVLNSTAGSATGFWNELNICADSGCTSYISHSQQWINSLGGSPATAGLSLAATLPSTPGTYYYQWCANTNSSGVHTVTEYGSNYGNDCSGTKSITVWPPITASCSVLPASGQALPTPTSFTWTAYPVGGTGSYSSYVWSSNSVPGTGNPWSTTYGAAGTYGATVKVTDSAGNSVGPVACSSQATVSKCGTATPNISANYTIVNKGKQANISWTATGVNASCTITGSDGFTETDTPPANTCTIASGQHTATINTQTTYKIVCDGSQISTVTVNVVPGFTEY